MPDTPPPELEYPARMRPRVPSALLLLTTLAISLPALGQEPSPAAARSPAAPASAIDDLIRRGDKARVARRWAEAATAYRNALEAAEKAGLDIQKRALIAGELGVCEVELGKYRDAAEHLEPSLLDYAALSREQQARFRQSRRRTEPHVQQLWIGVTPSGAQRWLDGRPLPASGPIFVEPGPHRVSATLEGYMEAGTPFHATAGGGPMAVRLVLGKVPPALYRRVASRL